MSLETSVANDLDPSNHVALGRGLEPVGDPHIQALPEVVGLEGSAPFEDSAGDLLPGEDPSPCVESQRQTAVVEQDQAVVTDRIDVTAKDDPVPRVLPDRLVDHVRATAVGGMGRPIHPRKDRTIVGNRFVLGLQRAGQSEGKDCDEEGLGR